MTKLLSLCIAAAVFCGFAISAVQQPKQVSECVFAALRDQEAARQADKERFIRAITGVPIGQANMILSMMPRPPSAAEVEIARNQNLRRIKELCRLKLDSGPEEGR